jgi:hypothetical protein
MRCFGEQFSVRADRRLRTREMLVQQLQRDLFDTRIVLKLLDQPFLAAIHGPEFRPFLLFPWARNMELPMNVLARLVTDGARNTVDTLATAVGLAAVHAGPSSVAHDRSPVLNPKDSEATSGKLRNPMCCA